MGSHVHRAGETVVAGTGGAAAELGEGRGLETCSTGKAHSTWWRTAHEECQGNRREAWKKASPSGGDRVGTSSLGVEGGDDVHGGYTCGAS